jgi:signal transduction histidine kinase
MRAACLTLYWRFRACFTFAFVAGFGMSAAAANSDSTAPLLQVTNIQQIRSLATQLPDVCYAIRLQADVWWANPARAIFVLKDDSGVAKLEMDLPGRAVESGTRVQLEGNGTITKIDGGFRIGTHGAVVNNDGLHAMIEKSGSAYLKAGRNPIRLEWFNRLERYGLEVEYQGPGVPRQKIPDAALFRIQRDASGSKPAPGLDFRYCEAPGEALPDFNTLTPIKTGTVNNFDLRILDRTEHIGICFTGFLDVPQEGLYRFYTRSDDGSRLFAGEPSLQWRGIGRAAMPQPRVFAIGEKLRDAEGGEWAEVEGKITFASEQPDGLKMELSGGTGRMRVEVPNRSGLSPALLLNRRVRATGFCQTAYSTDGHELLGVLLVPGREEIVMLESDAQTSNLATNTGALPLLVNAGDVHRLKREEAQRGYPVKLRGVITSVLPEHQAFTIQDSSRGLYVIDFSASRSDPPRIGEFLEIEGRTDALYFAPVVYASRVSSLGTATLPEPVHPTRDQLINGSLDAQYVEVQGILTGVQTNRVILLTREGTIKSELRVVGMRTEDFQRYENSLVRIRGCLLAFWDYVTHKVDVSQIKIYGADITVDQPAPADLFSTPLKTASALSLFDPQASVFQRVKVSGAILQVRGGEYFMMDGNTGVRFIAKDAAGLEVGDRAEVVGFPELGSASPVLREAVARKTGHTALPAARDLSEEQLIRADNDSTRVRIHAQLVNQRSAPSEQVLEMRVGLRTFLARLPAKSDYIEAIPPGSQLQLTGTYASQGGTRAGNPSVGSFELLLNSPADILVLARPPWWTLERLLYILGAFACVLAVTVLWITQLHRKVEQRTTELEIQIRERQRVEQQHALEQERARIAQDLHDELGSGLTEISMLGARARPAAVAVEKRGRYLEQMSEKARDMVLVLDEIVWAMNPTHDSMASLISYFSLYADRFLSLANIVWRVDGSVATSDRTVDARHRHQLFLAFKEALSNVVHHSGATEVRFSVQMQNGTIQMTIADNGRGLPQSDRTAEMDGITNMRTRIEHLGGKFEVESKTGQGTSLRFYLPSK